MFESSSLIYLLMANHSIGVVVIVVLLCVGGFIGGRMPDAVGKTRKKNE
jgi:hypothetical protein